MYDGVTKGRWLMYKEEANQIIHAALGRGFSQTDYFTAEACFGVGGLWPYLRDDSRHKWTWDDFAEFVAIRNFKVTLNSMERAIDHYADEGGLVMLAAEWLEGVKG